MRDCCVAWKNLIIEIEECKVTRTIEGSVANRQTGVRTKEGVEKLLNFDVIIARLNKPIIEAQDILLNADNTSIKIENVPDSVRSKRSYEFQNYPSYPYEDRILQQYPFYGRSREKIIVQPEQFYDINQNVKDIENYNSQKRKDIFNLQMVPPNPIANKNNQVAIDNKKSTDSSINPLDDSSQRNALNSPYYQKQCIPYSSQVGSSIPMLPLSPPVQYRYAPASAKYNPFLPFVPSSTDVPSVINSQYLNPSYPILPNPYAMYSFNPWNQQMQAPPGQYFLCSPISGAPIAQNSLTQFPAVEVRQSAETNEQIK